MVVRMLGLVQVVMVLVVAMGSLQVVSLLGILPLVLNTGMGGVVALRWRGGTVHGLPFVVLVLLQIKRVLVLLLFNRWGSICFQCPSCWMRVLMCCFGLVVLGF
jgi:hypothetical protein